MFISRRLSFVLGIIFEVNKLPPNTFLRTVRYIVPHTLSVPIFLIKNNLLPIVYLKEVSLLFLIHSLFLISLI